MIRPIISNCKCVIVEVDMYSLAVNLYVSLIRDAPDSSSLLTHSP